MTPSADVPNEGPGVAKPDDWVETMANLDVLTLSLTVIAQQLGGDEVEGSAGHMFDALSDLANRITSDVATLSGLADGKGIPVELFGKIDAVHAARGSTKKVEDLMAILAPEAATLDDVLGFMFNIDPGIDGLSDAQIASGFGDVP